MVCEVGTSDAGAVVVVTKVDTLALTLALTLTLTLTVDTLTLTLILTLTPGLTVGILVAETVVVIRRVLTLTLAEGIDVEGVEKGATDENETEEDAAIRTGKKSPVHVWFRIAIPADDIVLTGVMPANPTEGTDVFAAIAVVVIVVETFQLCPPVGRADVMVAAVVEVFHLYPPVGRIIGPLSVVLKLRVEPETFPVNEAGNFAEPFVEAVVEEKFHVGHPVGRIMGVLNLSVEREDPFHPNDAGKIVELFPAA